MLAISCIGDSALIRFLGQIFDPSTKLLPVTSPTISLTDYISQSEFLLVLFMRGILTKLRETASRFWRLPITVPLRLRAIRRRWSASYWSSSPDRRSWWATDRDYRQQRVTAVKKEVWMKPDTTPKQNQHVLTDCVLYEKQTLMWITRQQKQSKETEILH